MQFKKLLINFTLVGFSLVFYPMTALAGSGHEHGHSHSPVNQTKATENAIEIVSALVKRQKLDRSWSTIKMSSIKKITNLGKPEWQAIFVNEKISDTEKQKLYVFLTLGGDYIAANHTGK